MVSKAGAPPVDLQRFLAEKSKKKNAKKIKKNGFFSSLELGI
jgi:hypothetical protein